MRTNVSHANAGEHAGDGAPTRTAIPMQPMTRHDTSHARIPVTVIAGPTGAGKSSLVRHLLESASGQRIVAVVADDSVVDPAIVAERDGPWRTLRNGCRVIVEDDAATALTDLAGRADRPDHVLIDAPGPADPRRWQGLGYMPGYALDG